MKENIIIIPDIHGRTFWKQIIPYVEKVKEIIFLGDYLDPYWWEDISNEEAIENFKEIIEFKKKYYEKVTLLIGNHDCEYFIPEFRSCRVDYKNMKEIRSIFMKNINLFKIAIYHQYDNINYLFSHSCLLKGWVDVVKDKLDIESNDPKNVIDSLNRLLQCDNLDELRPILGIISFSRGGYDKYGSIVWAHWNEVCQCKFEYDGWYQIFGHSQQISKEMEKDIYKFDGTNKLAEPIIREWFACLDCKQIFQLDENLVISKFKN